VDGEKNLISYLEKATQAARKLECAQSMGDVDLQDARTTLSQFEELLCKSLELETVKTATDLSPEMAEAARASAALGLAGDYCEHAAETLERARQLAQDSANRLAKEVPTKMTTWRCKLQSKVMIKANPAKSLSIGFSSLFESKKAIAKPEPNKNQAGVFSTEEALKSATEEDLAQREKVRRF